MLEVKGVFKQFNVSGKAIDVLNDISMSIDKRSFSIIEGVSGCGKSTLLHLLSGLDQPTEGGMAFGKADPRIGMVFQNPRLLPWRRASPCLPAPDASAGRAPPGRRSGARRHRRTAAPAAAAPRRAGSSARWRTGGRPAGARVGFDPSGPIHDFPPGGALRRFHGRLARFHPMIEV